MYLRFFLISIFIAISSCQSFSQFRVEGNFWDNGFNFQTTVDSEVARSYLKKSFVNVNYEVNPAEVNFIKTWDEKPLSQENLRKLSRETSTDFATLYFVRRIMQQNDNRIAQARFETILTSLTENDYFKKNVNKNTLFVFVPGLGYKTEKEIGADFGTQRKILQELGIPNTIIEVEEFGRTLRNSEIVAESLKNLSRTYSSIIVVSASKSSAEVAIALGKYLKPEETHNIKAWISLCGVLRGTPYSAPFQSGILRAMVDLYLSFKGASTGVVADMTPQYMAEIYKTLKFPANIKMIQFVPVPLSGQVSARSMGGYMEMRREGPNDGRTMLADQIIEGGRVVFSFGSDHYFADKDIKEKSLAIVILAQELSLEEEINTALK